MAIFRKDVYYYPDVMLVGNKADNAEFYKEQPCFIAEVQSKSTARIDRHEKWPVYAHLPSLRYYLLADSRQRQVDYFWRDESGAWQNGILAEGQGLDIACDDYHTRLSLADIYEDVVF
ncbi:MAG: Uma2 family endonuclease [Methylovulum sp.]|nr:Uma2 family endonuclease [Methylovulum sp.]